MSPAEFDTRRRAQQLWISSDKKLRYNTENANGPPPRFTAQGLARANGARDGEG